MKYTPPKEINRWLRQTAQASQPWSQLAIAAGIAQGLFIIAQAALLAWLLGALIFERIPLADLHLPWLLLLPVLLLRALAGWARDEAGSRASAQVRQQLRIRLLDSLYARGPAWRQTQAGGALTACLIEQVDGLDGYLARYRPQMLLSVLIPAMILCVVFPLNWAAGLIFLLTAPLIPFFMMIVGFGTQARQEQQIVALKRMSAQFLDLMRGMHSLRLMNAHTRQIPRIAANAEDFRQRTMSVLRMAFLSSTVLEFFTSLAIAVSAVYLGFNFLGHLNFGYYGQDSSLVTAFFILMLAPEFYWPLRELGTHYHARSEAMAAAGELMQIEFAQTQASGQPRLSGQAPAIRFSHVDFAHVRDVGVLHQLDLDIAAGETIAIVGASGAGKTTLLRLVLGQISPDRGQVLIDDSDLNLLDPQAWREQIAWMSQHPRLLSASLADNLRVARQDASDEQLISALDFAGLAHWFAQLPDGLAARLGEGGRQLSGGQLRRLALARVWLRDAPLLLLDEPTASLDHETEAIIMAALAQLKIGRTLIILTHRRAPLALADRIALLENGHIAEIAKTATAPRIAAFLAGEEA